MSIGLSMHIYFIHLLNFHLFLHTSRLRHPLHVYKEVALTKRPVSYFQSYLNTLDSQQHTTLATTSTRTIASTLTRAASQTNSVAEPSQEHHRSLSITLTGTLIVPNDHTHRVRCAAKHCCCHRKRPMCLYTNELFTALPL